MYCQNTNKIRKINIISILIISFMVLTVSPLFSQNKEQGEEIKPYKINGLKEFHFFIKDFIQSSEEDKIHKLTPQIILDKTIEISRVVIMVDNLSDEDYFQVVYNAIVILREFLYDNDDFKGKDKELATKVIAYLGDLEQDLVNQNNENMSDTGTKAFLFDIANFKEDNSSNYDMKQEILKKGPKTAKKYIPMLSKVDLETINKLNSLGIDTLKLDFFKDLPADIAVSLVKFKGRKIFFPNLKNLDNEVLKILANFTKEIEFDKLEVTNKNIMILTTFKSSELRVKGLPAKFNKIIKKKLGKRYKRKIKFKKMEK